MPGLKRSPGMADIDVCEGAHRSGYTALETAFRKSQYGYLEDAPVVRINSLDRSRIPDLPPRSMPNGYPDSPSEDGYSSEQLVHEGFENRITPPPPSRKISLEDSGLPPTPPDATETTQEEQLTPPPLFADGVRNALESKKSGLTATPVNAVSPPTPDPSPPRPEPLPAVGQDEPRRAMVQKEKPHFLHPMIADSASWHILRQYPSSRADSFKTAREDQLSSANTSTSQVHLPEDDTLPQHWLDSTRELRLTDLGLDDTMAKETPKEVEPEPEGMRTPRDRRRRSKHESPPQTADGACDDWERHISYVSGPDELDVYLPVERGLKQEGTKQEVKGLGVSGADLQSDIQRSAEDVNNIIYKRIREENVKRHSLSSSTQGAITVGVVVPPSESTPRTLKRQNKCLSLREDSGSASKRNSVGSEHKLLGSRKVRQPERQKKLDDSPVLESSIRQVSSPARLGPDASNMTALAFASMQDSPSARQAAKFKPEADHKLRHLSYGDRLSNNQSIRRTSLHGSPASPKPAFEILREPEYATRRSSAGDRIANNIAVKRNSTEGARRSRVLEKSAFSNPTRNVIPSMTTEEEEWTPSAARIRRFSREERLENNGHVRRTSMEHAKDLQYVDVGDYSPDHRVRRTSMEHAKEFHHIDVAHHSPSQRGFPSPEKSAVPNSPRKSLDARFQHPSTTPMSTSQFSDRTEVELCEASGVRIYPHNNESLLVVQHGSRPVSKDKSTPDSSVLESQLRGLGKPIFAAQVDPPTPTLGVSQPSANVDSPLTNPRTAPEPPVIQFIPPTPNEELDRELTADDARGGILRAEVNFPQRRLSLLQRARRYSDSLFVRGASFRGRQRRTEPARDDRDMYLSPLWRPQGFWDEFESDEDEEDFEPLGTLPKGGDTSDVGEEERRRRAGLLFPRAMSKRLPGFRGQGGFLLGNSLGLDRHGTNNRRHYVGTREKTLSKRASEEVLRNMSSREYSALPRASSQNSLRRAAQTRTIVLPFSGGKRAQWVGTRQFRAKIRAMRLAREEREREKRREKLRSSIGFRVFHDTAGAR
ncbi:hypothetical protein LTR37_018312 [Vermiconidia calcicola]|uniref:Uncharacterized protein n=1 Tax=Vermiconidia calcicola TaxID=1690605 RepID=A0ACC3MJ31_9PEZI|nr:hypothetical protein LTR37_018312 [Vermiconidia calcicola]